METLCFYFPKQAGLLKFSELLTNSYLYIYQRPIHDKIEHDVHEILNTVSFSYWAGNNVTFEKKEISFDHQRSRKVFRILITLERAYCTPMAIMAMPMMTVLTCPNSRNGGYQI